MPFRAHAGQIAPRTPVSCRSLAVATNSRGIKTARFLRLGFFRSSATAEDVIARAFSELTEAKGIHKSSPL
jgi:hypothetical protein